MDILIYKKMKLELRLALNLFGSGLLANQKMEKYFQQVYAERNMVVAQRFLSNVVGGYGEHPVSTNGGDTWYLQLAIFFK